MTDIKSIVVLGHKVITFQRLVTYNDADLRLEIGESHPGILKELEENPSATLTRQGDQAVYATQAATFG